MTVLAIAGFAVMVAAGLLIVGPKVMEIVFGDDTTYGRVGLAVVAIGMGFHLAAGTLNQAALARGRANAACALWLLLRGALRRLGRPVDRSERQRAIELIQDEIRKTDLERRDVLDSVRSRDLLGLAGVQMPNRGRSCSTFGASCEARATESGRWRVAAHCPSHSRRISPTRRQTVDSRS